MGAAGGGGTLYFICCEGNAAEAPCWCGKELVANVCGLRPHRGKVCFPGRVWPLVVGARLGAPGAGATVVTSKPRLALINPLLLPDVLEREGAWGPGWESKGIAFSAESKPIDTSPF